MSCRLPDVTRGKPVTIFCDDRLVEAYEGETVAAALLGSAQRTLRWSPRRRQPRGLFCVMGVCFECVMVVDGEPGTRTCMTLVRDGMRVESESTKKSR